jgi:hypothetical protein
MKNTGRDGFVLLGFDEAVVVRLVCFLESVLTARTAMVFIGHVYLVVHRLPARFSLPSSDRERLVSSHNSLHEDAYEVHDVETEKHYRIRHPF